MPVYYNQPNPIGGLAYAAAQLPAQIANANYRMAQTDNANMLSGLNAENVRARTGKVEDERAKLAFQKRLNEDAYGAIMDPDNGLTDMQRMASLAALGGNRAQPTHGINAAKLRELNAGITQDKAMHDQLYQHKIEQLLLIILKLLLKIFLIKL